MRLTIRHETAYRYATPASRAIEVLRLTPRGHNGQYVATWRIDVDCDCRLEQIDRRVRQPDARIHASTGRSTD